MYACSEFMSVICLGCTCYEDIRVDLLGFARCDVASVIYL